MQVRFRRALKHAHEYPFWQPAFGARLRWDAFRRHWRLELSLWHTLVVEREPAKLQGRFRQEYELEFPEEPAP